MSGKMRWFSQILQINDGSGWVPYVQHHLSVPDYPIERGSKGYATMQKLLKLGYVYEQKPGENLPTEDTTDDSRTLP